MEQTGKTFPSDGTDARKWIGRILMAVILGEAIWNLIVSVMNDLVVPWLAGAVGQSSGSPTSFTRRSYNYPDLFVSLLEFCIAGITAVTINYFFQRPRAAGRVKQVKRSVSIVPAEPVRAITKSTAVAATTRETPLAAASSPDGKSDSGAPAIAVAPASPPIAKPLPVPPVSPVKAEPLQVNVEPPQVKAEPAKPKKNKEVYYNIVGEPVDSDED